MNAGAWQAAFDKYEALAGCARIAEGERDESFRQTLRGLSRQWPGALREGELIGPERVDARREAARAGLAAPGRSRAMWTQTPARAALCWEELDHLIAELLAYRRSHAKPRHAFRWEHYAQYVAQSPRRGAWPTALLDDAGLGPKLEVRSAYLCLAARAGLQLAQLNALLFARGGHWDRRAEDPSWAHA